MIKLQKKLLSVWVLLLITSGLVLLGVIMTGYEVRAEELNLTLTSTQKDFYENEEFQFDVTLLESLSNETLYLEVPKEFSLNAEGISQETQGVIKKVEVMDSTYKVILENSANYPVKLKIKGKLSAVGNFGIIVSDESGIKKEFPIRVKSNSSIDSDSELENKTSGFSVRANPPMEFDWNLLNSDGLDLSTFTEVDVNTPVELTGGLFDLQQRNYYLFLGHDGSGKYTYATEKFSKVNDMYVSMSTVPSQQRPILSPAILGVKKQVGTELTTNVIDHTYDNSRSSFFDIGEMSELTGPIELSAISNYKNLMVSQYIKNNELVAYGFLARGLPTMQDTVTDYQPVRIHGYATDLKTGRVRYDVSYYNLQDTEKIYAVNYGMHIDIGGAHQKSKLFSNGIDGLYFDEESTPRDGIGENLYFHMDGYMEKNGPTAYKIGNFNIAPLAAWSRIKDNNKHWIYGPVSGWLEPYDTWDDFSPVGYQFPTTHPVFAYRWNPVRVPAGGVGMASLDISLEEKKEVMPKSEKEYVNLTSLDTKNHLHDRLEFTLTASNSTSSKADWMDVTIKDVLPKELEVDTASLKLISYDGVEVALPSSYYNPDTRTLKSIPISLAPGESFKILFKAKIIGKTGDTIVNTMEAGNGDLEETREAEVSIPVEPETLSFNIVEEVFHEDGTIAGMAIPGEILTYKATAFDLGGERNYGENSTFVSVIDENLEGISDIQIKDKDGKVIGVGTVDASNLITAISSEVISNKKDIYLEYKATVKRDVTAGTIIKGKTSFQSSYENEPQFEPIYSNEVETLVDGLLEFISVPELVDFGTVSIVDYKKMVGADHTNLTMALVVGDTRKNRSKWWVTAQVEQEMTNGDDIQVGALKYVLNQQEMTLTTSAKTIYSNDGSLKDELFNISDDWGKTDSSDGLKLKVESNNVPKTTGSYEGIIRWTLRDTIE